jgi:hypothetical protein
MSLVSLILWLLVLLIILGVGWWGINTLCAAFGVPAQIRAVILVVFVVVVVLGILVALVGDGGRIPLRLTDWLGPLGPVNAQFGHPVEGVWLAG